jgi:hypothetical protein
VARRARTPAGLGAVLAALVIVTAAVTALPPAAGAAAPLIRPRTAPSSAASRRSPAAAIVVVAGTARPLRHSPRPPLASSAASHRSPRHAFRAAPLVESRIYFLVLIIVPARGPRAPPCSAEWTDRFTVAGGDPVNGGDPSGLAVDLPGVAGWARQNASSPDDNGFGDDCTDFVSRALVEGGGDTETSSGSFYADLLHKHDPTLWFQVHNLYGMTETSSSWANAHDLAEHFTYNGSVELVISLNLGTSSTDCGGGLSDDIPSTVQPGDIAFVDWSGASFTGISHAGVIVQVQPEIEIAQHTNNRIDTLADWAAGGPDPHIWIFNPGEG